MHPLLKRQLRRAGVEADADPPDAAQWPELLRRVSRAYEEHDQDRYLLERSQDLASQEMVALYRALRDERDQLDQRVRERTEALTLSEGRLTSLLSLSADWIWEQDAELRFTFFSDGIEAATGIKASTLIGLQRNEQDNFDASPEALAEYRANIEHRRAFRDFTYGMTRKDGVVRYIRISGEPVFGADGGFLGYRGVGRDVTLSALAEQRVNQLARFDSLTGLPNRNMFMAELERTLARARRNGQGFAVCFLDLDRFKVVNDTLGHDGGDERLKVMAERLRQATRAADLVARLGGDEFVVLLEQPGSAADTSALAQRMLQAAAEPVVVQGCRFQLTGSIGLALYPNDGDDAATLLKHADAAMYLAKDRGKNNVQFYTSELAQEAAAHFALESELRLALERDELTLHYQPKFDVATGRLSGLEALVRWDNSVRGVAGPCEFARL